MSSHAEIRNEVLQHDAFRSLTRCGGDGATHWLITLEIDGAERGIYGDTFRVVFRRAHEYLDALEALQMYASHCVSRSYAAMFMVVSRPGRPGLTKTERLARKLHEAGITPDIYGDEWTENGRRVHQLVWPGGSS